MLGVQCTYEHGSVAILIVPALIFFPPSNCTCMLAYSEINTVIPEINAKNVNFASHPSIRIVKRIIIFVNAINIPNSIDKDRQYDMLFTQYFMVPASCYKETELTDHI